MQIIIAIVFAFVLAYWIFRWKIFNNQRYTSTTFSLLFLVKLFFGVCFYLVYTVYYNDIQSSDMHKYYNDAVKIFELTKEQPLSYLSILSGIEVSAKYEIITQQLNFWYQEESAAVINDSRMIIRFNLMMMPFSRGNIYLHLVMMVFLSFIGLTFIYLSLEKYFIKKEILLLFSCFGIPSVMFWSSGIMKEGLLMFFFGILIFYLLNTKKVFYKRFFLILVSFIGMFFAKFYVALALVPSLFFLCIYNYSKRKKIYWSLTITCVLVISISLVFNSLLNNLPLQKLSKKQNDFINLSMGGVYLSNTISPFDTIFTLKQASLINYTQIIEGNTAKLKPGVIYHHWKNPGNADTLIASNNQHKYVILKVLQPTGSAITLKRLMPSYTSVIKLFPEAFINVFFRPFIFDVENIFSFLACIENILFVCLLIALLFIFKKPTFESQSIIVFALLFVFTLYTLVGLTTPVLGAAVRYKVPALPFLMISIFLFYDYSKLHQLFNKLIKP